MIGMPWNPSVVHGEISTTIRGLRNSSSRLRILLRLPSDPSILPSHLKPPRRFLPAIPPSAKLASTIAMFHIITCKIKEGSVAKEQSCEVDPWCALFVSKKQTLTMTALEDAWVIRQTLSAKNHQLANLAFWRTLLFGKNSWCTMLRKHMCALSSALGKDSEILHFHFYARTDNLESGSHDSFRCLYKHALY
jgi:hypothetical protein